MNSLKAITENSEEPQISMNSGLSEAIRITNVANGSFRRDSQRFSMSSQDRDMRRRLSSEKIKHDFQQLADLSTILEMSREHRISSFGNLMESDSVPVTTENSGNLGMSSNSSAVRKSLIETTINCTTVSVKSTATTTNVKKVAKKRAKTEKTAKTKEKVDKKLNNSIISVYDFTDEEENKENVMPLMPVRKSKRIRSTQK